ncbi:MAG: hypothetical protein HS127_05030 [Planctomycetia bacterium]|jgi:hypothetical protein|uniref:hypothetical protein n=1 Tax=Candidatus Kuenenia sp. TaxID=2499824 RepID=UPI001DC33C7C|nr:hypothetical protein [Planctomycetia bacterium]GJQ50027.1 MAG: hypothetical protein HKUEN01_24130 [Candidatus Kuenenia stuttgartiensis]
MENKNVLPEKPGRYPAIPVCEHIGNRRKDCVALKHHSFLGTKDIEPCLASVVLLFGKSKGIRFIYWIQS